MTRITAISTSLPTWDSVPGRALGYKWVTEKLQSNYPRFGVNTIVQKLASAVLTQLNISVEENQKDCLVFPSQDAARHCISFIRAHYKTSDIQAGVTEFRLRRGHKAGHDHVYNGVPLSSRWARFFAVVYDAEAKEGAHFWGMFGDGLGNRHAEFSFVDLGVYVCAFEYSNGTRATHTAVQEQEGKVKKEIKSRIARLVTSENSSLTPPTESDVFLCPKGMSNKFPFPCWPYAETPKCVGNTGYARFTLYDQGSTSEIDDLESGLSSGTQIRVLFCEVPSNPLLRTPDLHRIRALADKHNFIVVCDETLGTFINVDVLPYVDIAITSLTKIFNGAGNAMGGSVTLHDSLAAGYEDLLFSAEAQILAQSSRDIESRIHKCNVNALALSTFLSQQPYIKTVLYPFHSETRPLYKRYRRQNGGYGYVLSKLFADPGMAIRFYNVLDMRKGPSVGTNFRLVLPYAWLVHVLDMEWAESQGIPRHIVRISVGLEREGDLISCVGRALEGAARGG
ncbi:pyridoxal phosphate-dependent transferase [Aspergillus venezuelensis]